MRKADFVQELAGKISLTGKETEAVVDAFWAIIADTLKKGDEIVFPQGKFIAVKKPAREARNPMTGATVKVPAKVVPQFKPAKKLKDELLG